MKTLFKIAALAAVGFAVAFAVFSCAAEPELSGVDWKKINSQYDPAKNTDARLPEGFSIPSVEFKTGENGANELTITFPTESDFLRAGKGNVEAGLRAFLSFHHFTRANEPVPGEADRLGAPLSYTFVRQDANKITVRLAKKFVAGDSSVIMKIDGTKYTYRGGVKLDLVGRGGGGQAGYDDAFFEFRVIVVPDPDFDPDLDDPVEPGPFGFIGPRWESGQGLGLNQGWSFTLEAIDPMSADEDGVIFDLPVASLKLPGIYGDDFDEVSPIYSAVANQLMAGLKIQKFEDGNWSDVSGPTFTYDPDYDPISVYVDTLTLEDLVPYRVMWKGSAPVTTVREYFEVKQFVKIIGENTPNDPWLPAYYQTGTVYGPVTGVSDSRIPLEKFYVSIYSKDFLNQNVVIDVLFNEGRGIGDGRAARWLKDYGNDKETFKENFKIAYYRGVDGNPVVPPAGTKFYEATNLVYIPIKDFEMRSFNPNEAPDIGLNAVRITLDPAYKWVTGARYFHISPEIGYTDNKTVFGDLTNFTHNFFKEYQLTEQSLDGFLQYTPPTPLTAGVWADGNLPLYGRVDRYSFPVTEDETYYIWINNRYNGRLPRDKTGIVGVSVYRDGTQIISSNGYSTNIWETPVSFTATKTGVVEVRVSVYQNDNYAGTYGIVYDDNDDRPGGDGWTEPVSAITLYEDIWEDGNIATTGGEQWYKFDATTSAANGQYIYADFGTLTDLNVQLYNEDGEKEGALTNLSGSSLSYTSRTLITNVTYYIRVYPYNLTSNAARGTFRIAFSTATAAPSVTVPADYTTLYPGVWADGIITTEKPEQWYTFEATADPQYIHAAFGSLTTIIVGLYDSEGTAVGNETRLTSSASYSYISRPVTEEETYYIRVRKDGVSTGSGTYKIMFNEKNSVAVKPPTNATPLEFGVWADGSITSTNRERWYTFTASTSATNGQYIHTDFGTLTSLKLQLYDEEGYPVGAETALPAGTTTYISRTVTEDEIYFIKVTPGTYNSNGTYKILFNERNTVAVALPADPIPLTFAVWEDGNITTLGGEQWFTFEASAVAHYIHADFGTLQSLKVQLYDEEGYPVQDEATLSGNTRNVQRTGLTEDGEYFIKVTPSTGRGTYRILYNNRNVAPVDLPTTGVIDLTINVWGNGNIATTGGEQWYKFIASTSAANGQYIHALFGTLTGLRVQLYDEEGYPVGNEATLSGTTTYMNRTVGLGKEHFIRVTPSTATSHGTYNIMFNERSTAPVILPTTGVTTLTPNVWATNGNIPTAGGQQWFKFDATTSATLGQYIHATFGTLTSLRVQLYDDEGYPAPQSSLEVTLTGTTTSTSRTLGLGETYYIRVRASNDTATGTYQIKFSTYSFAVWPPEPCTELTTTPAVIWADGYIADVSEVQWFSFTATATSHYIQFTWGSMSDVHMQLYTSVGVTSGTESNVYSGTTSAQRTGLTAGETYYIRIRPYAGVNGTSGTYWIAVNSASARPPFTPLPNTGVIPLALDEWKDGNIPTARGVQWFTFTASATSHYIHSAFGTLAGLRVETYNDAGTVVGTTAVFSGTTTNAQRTGLAIGDTYYIRVTPNTAAVGFGTYKIGFTSGSTAPPIDLPGDDDAIPLTLDEWADGNITTAGGEQWFRFVATATSHYIHISFGTLTGTRVQPYTSTGLTSGAEFTTTPSNRTGLTTGATYYIKVMPSTATGTGTYRIKFNSSTMAQWPPECTPLDAPDGNGINEWTDGNITTSGGNQWFSFIATAATHYIHGKHGTLTDWYVQLYTSAGATTGSESNMYNTLSFSRTGLTVGSTYYIRTRPYSSTGTYQIAFNTSATPPPVKITPPSTSTPLTAGVLVAGSITNDNASGVWYSFTATAGATYYIWLDDADNSTGLVDAKIAAYYSDGTEIFDADVNTRTITANSAGTIYIKVYPYSTGRGNFRVGYNTVNTKPTL
jgi:hypothetical protein